MMMMMMMIIGILIGLSLGLMSAALLLFHHGRVLSKHRRLNISERKLVHKRIISSLPNRRRDR